MRISIKRRLLISNVLMLVIPVVLTSILNIVIIWVLLGRATTFFISPNVSDIPIEQSLMLGFDIPDMHFSDDVAVFYQLENGSQLLILPEQMKSRFERLTLSEESMYLELAIFSESLIQQITFWGEHERIFQMLLLVFLVVVTLLANYFLVRFSLKPIMTFLNTLTKGFHEISDGNLVYRLNHNGGNEFDSISTHFNDMTTRLHEMVEQKKADEQNRKELIAGIAHDLRTPLTSIRTYTEGLELGMASTPALQEKYLSTIKNKTNDMEHILNQLFLFSKLDIGEFPVRLDKCDIGNWLYQFVQNARDEYSRRGLQIKLEKNITSSYLLVDEVQLGNVLTNMLENSVKYGNVDNLQAVIDCEQISDHIILRITDNGVGVPNEVLTKLFDIFYRNDKARTKPSGGSGLGLAISAKLIERMGGSIKAENATDGGFTILIKLPVVTEGALQK